MSGVPQVEGNDLKDAAFQVAWRASPEYRSAVRGAWIVYLLPLAVGVGTFIFAQTYGQALELDRGLKGADAVAIHLLYVLLFTLPVGFAAYSFAIFRIKVKREELRERLQVAEAQQELEQAERNAHAANALGLESLWDVTQKRLDYYHTLATAQAEVSFRHSQRAVIGGFGALVVALLVATFSGSTGAAVASGLVGVAGAALAGYLSKTFLRTQETTSAQLRSYFSQPLTFSQHLAAERLLNLLDGEQKAAAVREHDPGHGWVFSGSWGERGVEEGWGFRGGGESRRRVASRLQPCGSDSARGQNSESNSYRN